jgi:hypothetical protein
MTICTLAGNVGGARHHGNMAEESPLTGRPLTGTLAAGDDALDGFSPATRAWFDGAFAEPTQAQAGAWRAIGKGEDTLVVAPTGSGKLRAAGRHGAAMEQVAKLPPPVDAGTRPQSEPPPAERAGGTGPQPAARSPRGLAGPVASRPARGARPRFGAGQAAAAVAAEEERPQALRAGRDDAGAAGRAGPRVRHEPGGRAGGAPVTGVERR